MKSATLLPRHGVVPAARAPWMGHFVFEYLLALPAGALLAMVWVALDPDSYYVFTYAAGFPVNDIAMVFFFGLITKEIVEATAPGGLFHPWRRIILPVACALGAVSASVALYPPLSRAFGTPRLAGGWPVLCGIDIALAYFAAKLIFRRHPVVTFVLIMAIAANALGFMTLAMFYPATPVQIVPALAFMAASVAFAAALRIWCVRSFWPYVLVAGTASWFGLYFAGVHPAFALVPVIMFLPHAPHDPGFFVDAPPDARDALDRFEVWCRFPAQAALLLFGLVNAGVPAGAVDDGQWALPLSLLAGRLVGILAAAAIAIAAGAPMPNRVGWRELVVIAVVASTGFTLALFFASVVFPAGQLLSETKMGALFTIVAPLLAVAAAWVLAVGRFER